MMQVKQQKSTCFPAGSFSSYIPICPLWMTYSRNDQLKVAERKALLNGCLCAREDTGVT